RDFLIYLWAKRALALWDDPRGPRNGGLDRADAAYLVAELGSPQFERAAAIVYAWTEGVLDYVAQASPALAETVRRIREVDPGSYIPLRREFAEFERQYRSGGGGGNTAASRAELTKRLRGSTRRIKNPVHSMLVQTKELVLKAHQRRVIDQILHLTRTVKGLGHYAVEVPAERVPAAQRPLSGLLERIEAQEAAQQGRVQELSAQDREDLAHREFLDGEPVARLTGEEFSQGEGGMLRDRIAQWYAEHDRATVEVGGVGTVQLDRRAVERSLSHGHNRAKIAAFAAVPDVLRRGRLVHEEPLRGSTQSGRFLHLAAPVEVGGRGHILDVVVKADTSGGRLYLHNVVLREKLQHPPTQGTGGPGSAVAASEAGKRSASTDAGVIETVLQRIYSVKADNLEAGAREGVEGLTSPSRSQVTNEDARSRGPSRELLVQGWQPVKEQGMAAGEAEGTDSSSLLEEMVNFFGPAAEEPKAGEWPRLPVWEDGRLRWYELEPELYAALAAMDAAQVSPVVEWLGGKWARAFRLGTTGLNAGFSLITNTTRDLTTLMLNSTANGSRGDGRGTILHHGIVAQKRHKSALLEGNARVLCRMQPEGGRKVPVCRVHLTER
ncbi:hypothetical protein, partial [Cephaloticoccus primus]|uniref:LPD3 domain-containing protein n=1 Tax=Cephaloticoccus primus TaxID=1548207 RepID=UPI0018D31CC9